MNSRSHVDILFIIKPSVKPEVNHGVQWNCVKPSEQA